MSRAPRTAIVLSWLSRSAAQERENYGNSPFEIAAVDFGGKTIIAYRELDDVLALTTTGGERLADARNR